MIQVTSKGDKRNLKKNTEDIHNLQQKDIPQYERKYLQSSLKNSGNTGGPSRAACTEDAGDDNEIEATLFNSNGTTGDAITVYCNISNGDIPPGALNQASPRLEINDVIYVQSINWDDSGTPTQRWECVTNFMTTEECDCVGPDHVFNSIAVASDEKISLDGVLDGDTFIRHNTADGEVEHAVETDTVTTW